MNKPSFRVSVVGVLLLSVIFIFPEAAMAQKLIVGWSAVSALSRPCLRKALSICPTCAGPICRGARTMASNKKRPLRSAY